MSNRLEKLRVQNFRSMADVTVETKPLNVLFGPNGAGKSTFLDAIWFIRDCAIRGVDLASSDRSHGIGALWDGADKRANILIELEAESAIYEVSLGFSAGRIEPFVGEVLRSRDRKTPLINRVIGSNKAEFYHNRLKKSMPVELREPEKLAFTRYLDLEENTPDAASGLDKLLRYIHFYQAREADLDGLKKRGSETDYHTWLWERGQNLWSVLRNLHDRKSVDDRYDTVIEFMQKSFPSFDNLLLEQTASNSVYGSFLEKKRRQPIRASGVSDGHLQMLVHLTALFSEGKDCPSLILFDEPETSLHPHAIAIFAEAVKLATEHWNKQVFISTHSPVLISQFEPKDILALEIGASGETVITRVSEIEDIRDLLEQYAVGSLYMAEAIAPQSKTLTHAVDFLLSE